MNEPSVGQKWRSRDKRDAGRTVTVEEITEHFVYVRSIRRSRIRRGLFPAQYELVTS